MKKSKIILTLVFISLQLSLIAQENANKTMRSFVPKSKAYDIYYPLDFKINEDDNGIVSISNPTSGINITISTYRLTKKINDAVLIDLINSFINETYKKKHKVEDWNSYKTKFDNVVRLKTYFEKTNWYWFGINDKKSIVILSVNKESEITPEELNLVEFMINSLVFN